jgi:T5SS/PEP-CTERM-associated repeat protein
MGEWLGHGGDINTASNYASIGANLLAFPIFGSYYYGIPSTVPPGPNDFVGFGEQYHTSPGHQVNMPPSEGSPGLTLPRDVLVVQMEASKVIGAIPPANFQPVLTPASYTVSGSATIGGLSVGSGGVVTLSGAITTNGNATPGTYSFVVLNGTADVTGTLTSLSYGDVTNKGELEIGGGNASFTKGTIGSTSQVSSLVVSATDGSAHVDVRTNGTLTTAGLLIGTATNSGLVPGSGAVWVEGGVLNDTDMTNGIEVGVGIGAVGSIDVVGQVNSQTVSVGTGAVSVASGPGGQGTVDIHSPQGAATATVWNNVGTFTVGTGGSLEIEAAALLTGALTLDANANLLGGTINVNTVAGDLTLENNATLNINAPQGATALLESPLIKSRSGTTFMVNGGTVTDTNVPAPNGPAGLELDGSITWMNANVIENAASNAAITIGWDDGTGSPQASLASQKGTVQTDYTTIGASVIGGTASDGTLIVSGGSWTDSGTNTSILIGGNGTGTLEVTNAGTLTDMGQAVLGTMFGGEGQTTANNAYVIGANALWTIAGGLTLSSGGDSSLSVTGGGTVSVGGTVLVNAQSGEGSGILVTQSTLGVAGAMTLGGTGTGSGEGYLTVNNGGAVSVTGSIELANGRIDIDNSGNLTAAGLTIDIGATGDPNVLDIKNGGTLSLGAGTLALGELVQVELASGATIDAGAVTLASRTTTIEGSGTIGGAGDMISGSGIITADQGSLAVQGTLSGSALVNINANSDIAFANTPTFSSLTFAGTGGVLELTDPDPGDPPFIVASNVLGFAQTDTIIVHNLITANSVNWRAGTLYVLDIAGAVVAAITMPAASNATADFQFSEIGSDATITIGTPTPPVISPLTATPHSNIDLSTANVSVAVPIGPISDPGASPSTVVTVTVSSETGGLTANTSAEGGGGTITGFGATALEIVGSLTQVNADLTTLTYTPEVPGTDTVTIAASDDSGLADTTSFTVDLSDTPPGEAVPGAQSVTAGTAAPIAGVGITDTLSDPTQIFTVTVSDLSGALSTAQTGAATVTGIGGETLTVTGDLAAVNEALGTLTYTGVIGDTADTLTVLAADQYGGTSTATVALTLTQPATPTETDWASPFDGDAGNAANWTAGVPTAALIAVATDGDYTITGAITAGQVVVDGGPTFTGSVDSVGLAGDFETFIVDQNGATFDGGTLTTPSVVVGDSASSTAMLTLDDGAVATLSGFGPEGQAEAAYVGYAAGSSSGLLVTGATLTSATGFSVGDDGTGALDISAGGVVTAGSAGGSFADVVAGNDTTGVGAISVDGAGSSFSSDAVLFLGENGDGALDITNGGAVTSDGEAGGATAILGFGTTASGAASVDGAGSLWDVTQSLVIGYDGSGFASVSDGGTLEVDGPLLRVGRDATGSGVLSLDGTGSAVEAPDATLYLGLDGSAALSIADGATATVGNVMFGVNSDVSAASIDIEDAGSELNVLGTLSDGLAPELTVTVNGGTIATGGGFDVGNGSDDIVNVSSGGAITGGIGLTPGAIMTFDETSLLGGAITFLGGTLVYAPSPAAVSADALANAITIGAAAAGGTSELDAGGAGLNLSGTIAFGSSAGSNLLISGSIAVGGPITGFAPGDTLDLRNFSGVTAGDTATWFDNELTLNATEFGGGAVLETLAMPGNYTNDTFSTVPDGSGAGAGDGVDLTVSLACFVAGTRILTAVGHAAVENLRVGDMVPTRFGGTVPIRWIGHRRLDCRRHPDPRLLQPIRIGSGAFGDGIPARDLLVSPDHALFIDNVLVPARLLVNGASIVRETQCRKVTYYHVELDRHDILLAEGLPAESYLDTGNRAMFENAKQPLRLHPDFSDGQVGRETRSCATFAGRPDQVEPVWRSLAERAETAGRALPEPPVVVDDPDISIRSGNQIIGPVVAAGDRYVFVLPHGAEPVRLVSRTARPSDARPWVCDDRLLGVKVGRLVLRRGDHVRDVALDDPMLDHGWWPVECDDGRACRWSNGNATLPDLGGGVLEVKLFDRMRYRVPVPGGAPMTKVLSQGAMAGDDA